MSPIFGTHFRTRAHGPHARFFCQDAFCTNFKPNLCALCLLNFIPQCSIIVSQQRKGKVKIMKCPHCVSTAQVRSTGAPTLSDNELILTERFTCGCGCLFDIDYERNRDDIWEWETTVIHFVDKELIKKFQKS